MSEAAILWLFGTIIGVLTTVIGGLMVAMLGHVSKCTTAQLENAKTLTEIGTNVERIMREIGDRHSGIRGEVHKHTGQLGTLADHIDQLRDKVGMRPLDLADTFRQERE